MSDPAPLFAGRSLAERQLDRVRRVLEVVEGHRVWPLILAAEIWVCLPFFILGPYSAMLVHDEWDSLLSLTSSLRNLPSGALWYPLGASGVDRLALGYAAPGEIRIFAALPDWLAYLLLRLASQTASAGGAYWFGRRWLGLGWPGALFAALVHGALFHQYQLAAMVVPLVAGLSLALADNPRDWRRWAVGATSAVFYAAFCYLPLAVIFPPLYGAVLVVVARHRVRLADLIALAGFFLLVYLLRVQDLLAIIANAPDSHRHALAMRAPLLSISDQAVALLREQIPGPLSAALAAAWLSVALGRRFGRSWGWVAGGWLGLLLIHLSLVALLPLLAQVYPSAKSVNPTRMWMVAAPYVAFVGGFAIDALASRLKEGSVGRSHWEAAVLLLLAIMLLFSDLAAKAALALDWVKDGSQARNLTSPAMIALAGRIRMEAEPVRVLSYGLRPAFAQTYGLEAADGYMVMLPRRYHAYWNKAVETAKARDPEYAVQTQDWGHILAVGNTFGVDLRVANQRFAELYSLNMFSLANVGYIVSRQRLTDPELVDTGLSDPGRSWSERSVADKILVNLAENFSGLRSVYIYRNISVLPRFRLVEGIEVKPSEHEVLEWLATADMAMLRRTAVLAGPDAPTLANGQVFRAGQVEIRLHQPDHVRLHVSGDGPRFLVVGIPFSRYWRAAIDGVPATLLPVNGAFSGLLIPSGVGRVDLDYRPPYSPG